MVERFTVYQQNHSLAETQL